MAGRVQVREITNDEGNRLLRIVRRSSGSVVTWRRAQMVLLSAWSLTKLAEFLVGEGVVDDISHEGLRVLLGDEGVSFQVIKTWKVSRDPDFEAKKNRVLELYDIAEGNTEPVDGDPTVVLCMDEFGPLNLLPRPGRQWARPHPSRSHEPASNRGVRDGEQHIPERPG